MSSADISFEEGRVATSEVAKAWLFHLLALAFPLSSLVFLWTGPHKWWVAPLYLLPLALVQYLDTRPLEERRQPVDSLPSWPFSAIVYGLAFLQFVVICELVRMFSHQAIFSADMLMVFLLVGGTSGFSIVTAHELIHRRNRAEQLLGRLLLCTVLYEHFYTEHLRGHHLRVGTPEDPATARFGERFNAFYRRTVPAQFRSAWQLECRRLGDPTMPLWDRRMLRNRILHGLAVGWGLAFAILLGFGLVPFFAFLLQAFVAARLLEVVNYFEHWGLRRRGTRPRPEDSWDTHSWITYHGLVGLSRHADHHAYPARPYEQLRVWEEAPLLPVGYVALVDMVLTRNDDFIRIATRELERRQLGPFAEGAEPEELAALAEQPRKAGQRRLGDRIFGFLPRGLRPVLVFLGVVAAVSLGGSIEAGFSAPFLAGFARNGVIIAIVVRNGVIIAIVVAALGLQAWLGRRTGNGWIAWGSAIALFVALGRLSEPLIGV
jgi:alkane 1-monooxygenase